MIDLPNGYRATLVVGMEVHVERRTNAAPDTDASSRESIE